MTRRGFFFKAYHHPMLFRRRGARHDSRVCHGQLHEMIQQEGRLQAAVAAACSAQPAVPVLLSARPVTRPPGSPPRLTASAKTLSKRAASMTPSRGRGRGGQSCQEAQAALAALHVAMRGERAACLEEVRLQRKGALHEARAARQGHKTELVVQREQAARARLETKMQRLQYRKAKAEAGLGPQPGQLAAGAGMVAVGAAAFLLL